MTMKKYGKLLVYELKTILRDPMNVLMLFYPFMMLGILGWLLPAILDRSGAASNARTITLLIGFVVAISLGGYMMGALLGFSLLENKDEKTLWSIAVTPVTVAGYALFKTIYAFAFAILGNVVMVAGMKLLCADAYTIEYGGVAFSLFDDITYGQILVFAVVSSLIVPFVGAMFAGFSRNKIEGFAYVKTGAIIVMIPMLALLDSLQDGKQYFLGIAPNFWPVKALLNIALQSTHAADMPFWLYMAIGALYPLALGAFAMRTFVKKSGLK
jgi:fluoroquinolone transport system permease protein